MFSPMIISKYSICVICVYCVYAQGEHGYSMRRIALGEEYGSVQSRI